MRRFAGILAPCALAALLLWMLARPDAALAGAASGLSLWALRVLPALLPYYILAQMLVESGAIARAGRPLGGVARILFRLPGSAAPSLLLALISGSPAGARVAGQLHGRDDFTPDEALRFTAVGAMTGPLFLAGTAGGLLDDRRAGPAILCACLIAALLNGLLWRFFGAPARREKEHPAPISPLLRTFPGAVQGGCSALIAIGGVIALFSTLVALLEDAGALAMAAAPLSPLFGGSGPAQAMLRGALEMTSGVRAVAELALPLSSRTALVCTLCSFGGLAVAAQATLFLKGAVPPRLYLLQRCTQAIWGLFASLALSPLFFPEREAIASAVSFCPLCIAIFFIAGSVALLFWHFLRNRPRPARKSRALPHNKGSVSAREIFVAYKEP